MERCALLVSEEKLKELGISAETLAEQWANYEGDPKNFESSLRQL